MKVFYGSAIEGFKDRKQRAHVNRFITETIKKLDNSVITEHTKG